MVSKRCDGKNRTTKHTNNVPYTALSTVIIALGIRARNGPSLPKKSVCCAGLCID